MSAALSPKMASGITLRELRLVVIERLRAAQIEAPEADARVLLKFAFSLDDAALVSASHTPISAEQQAYTVRLIDRRVAGEPVARIMGQKEFWSHLFRLGTDTLVPRPETETIVETALSIFPAHDAKLRVLDLGTGSGILLAAILLERKQATGIGIDRSENTLRNARENLNALGLTERAQFICGDWSAALDQRFDLVVANPPYIASKDITSLAREVREHDPRAALDGGIDGLDAYRKIIAELPQLISGEGVAVLELGIGQEDQVAALVRARGLEVRGPARRDLGNVPRALIVYPPKQK